MTSAQLMANALSSGLADDATTSAALDAIREESGCTLLAAVLEVARMYHATRNARDIKEANAYLSKESDVRIELERSITFECSAIVDGAYLTIVCKEGDDWPRATDTSIFADGEWVRCFHVEVGALWVKREASRIMVEREREANRPRRRRSR